MIDNRRKRHKDQKTQQDEEMHRDDKCKQRDDDRLKKTFYGMKAKRCPDRRADTIVMDLVYISIDLGMMHPSVQPVVICLMDK